MIMKRKDNLEKLSLVSMYWFLNLHYEEVGWGGQGIKLFII